jgi:ketosteroid isomerase-like protein
MPDTTALVVVREAWEKWVAGDLDGFVKLFDPDGVWNNAGHNRISGPRRGHAEITAVAQLVFEISGGTLKAQPIELAASGENSVLGYFQLDAERPGATIHQNGLQKWLVRNGKIVSLDNAFLNQDEMDEFFK